MVMVWARFVRRVEERHGPVGVRAAVELMNGALFCSRHSSDLSENFE
jgi:hypothetical protein